MKLDADKILIQLEAEDKAVIQTLDIYDCVESTNDRVSSEILTAYQPWAICLSENQTRGRGRIGHTWHSTAYQNIYFSAAWRTYQPAASLISLSLVIGMTCIDMLTAYGIQSGLKLKWPNDIFYELRKLAGILIEIRPKNKYITDLIIGIGINVNIPVTTDSPISQPWTSLLDITQVTHDRNTLVAQLIHCLFKNVHRFEQKGFQPFHELWPQYDVYYNQPIILTLHDHCFSGIAKGVDKNGQYLLQTIDGLKSFAAGSLNLNIKQP